MNAHADIAHSVAHGAFTIERTYPNVTPQRVFDAFATETGKDGWFSGPNEAWSIVERRFDFRVGGRERLVGKWQSGLVTEFDATYFDIIPGERIVYAYEMRLDGRKISVSLATFEFKAAEFKAAELKAGGGGTRLIMNEQGAFLDGYDDNGSRERGSQEIMDKLSAYLEAG